VWLFTTDHGLPWFIYPLAVSVILCGSLYLVPFPFYSLLLLLFELTRYTSSGVAQRGEALAPAPLTRFGHHQLHHHLHVRTPFFFISATCPHLI
jgi:hypothetical protein